MDVCTSSTKASDIFLLPKTKNVMFEPRSESGPKIRQNLNDLIHRRDRRLGGTVLDRRVCSEPV